MDEKKKAYSREWRRKNRDKVKAYQKISAMRRVIAAIEAGKIEIINKPEIREAK